MAGEIDPFGQRQEALDAFLDGKVDEGFVIETHTDTHAIIIEGRQGFWSRFGPGDGGRRYVVEVDEHGAVIMSPAEPRRS